MGSQVAFSSCDMLATRKASDFEAFWSLYFWMTDALNLYSYNLVFRTKQHLPYFHALCMIKSQKNKNENKQKKNCKIVVYRTICKLLSKRDETH